MVLVCVAVGHDVAKEPRDTGRRGEETCGGSELALSAQSLPHLPSPRETSESTAAWPEGSGNQPGEHQRALPLWSGQRLVPSSTPLLIINQLIRSNL